MIGTTTIASRMATMIAAHRYASEVMADASHEDDIQRTVDASNTLARATEVEAAALQALLKHRPASMREATDRLEYLFEKDGPWHEFRPTKAESGWVIASMREFEATQHEENDSLPRVREEAQA